MATGYTAAVNEGKIDFNGFVRQCARAFGALIEMRDDPMDAPIPAEFKPSAYHSEQLARSVVELRELEAMTPEALEAFGLKAKKEDIDYNQKSIADKAVVRKRLEDMLVEVNAWEPPSSDHYGLKSFMIQQLSDTVAWDCDIKYNEENIQKATVKTAKGFWDDAVKAAKWSVDYHTKKSADDQTRSSDKTRWIQQLLGSLKK